MKPWGRLGHLGAPGWLLLAAACASGRAGPPAGEPLPAWAQTESETHREPEVVRGVHRVEKGETWFRIAKAYGLSPEELAVANGRDVTSALAVGTELLIPAAVEPATAPGAMATMAGRPAAEAPAPSATAKAWDTPVEPLAGQALPPELLRAFSVPAPAPGDIPLPDTLARAFDHPTAPIPRPALAPCSDGPGQVRRGIRQHWAGPGGRRAPQASRHRRENGRDAPGDGGLRSGRRAAVAAGGGSCTLASEGRAGSRMTGLTWQRRPGRPSGRPGRASCFLPVRSPATA